MYVFNKFLSSLFLFHCDQRWIGAQGVRITGINDLHTVTDPTIDLNIWFLCWIWFFFVSSKYQNHYVRWWFNEAIVLSDILRNNNDSHPISFYLFISEDLPFRIRYQFMESKSHKWLIQNNCSAIFSLVSEKYNYAWDNNTFRSA